MAAYRADMVGGCAADRLKRIAEEVFPTLEERQTWLKQVTEDLWQGRVELVIEACRPLAKKSKWAQQSLMYYSNNIERMRYDQFRAANLLIGSGVIESGCKQIVSHPTPQTSWRRMAFGLRDLDRQSPNGLDER